MEKTTKITPPDLDTDFLNCSWAKAEFVIDGFKVSITHEYYNNKLVKLIYVNGFQKGEWYVNHELEEPKRFAYITSKFVFKKSFRDGIIKHYRGAEKKEAKKEYERKIKRYNFMTTVNVKTIIKQWCDRDINKSISLVDANGNIIFKYK